MISNIIASIATILTIGGLFISLGLGAIFQSEEIMGYGFLMALSALPFGLILLLMAIWDG